MDAGHAYRIYLTEWARCFGPRYKRLARKVRRVLDDREATEVDYETLLAEVNAAGAGPDDEAEPAATDGKPKAKRRQRKSNKVRPLAPKQLEVIELHADCKGNFAEVARRLGLDRKTVVEQFEAGNKKLGIEVVKHKTKPLPADRREQANVAKEDDNRLK